MEDFRLSREKYSKSLTGKGAAVKGARWNSPGTEIIYTSPNRSLAMAEVAVHFTLATLPPDYVMMTISIPDTLSKNRVNLIDLPKDWNTFPHSVSTQRIGDDFIIENKFCLLEVPSAVTQGDFNILINPNHIDFHKIVIVDSEPFPFDKRIFK